MHPAVCVDAGRHLDPNARDNTKNEFFRNLLDCFTVLAYPLPPSSKGNAPISDPHSPRPFP